MKKPIVRCRCGHRVLSKEVLRTDLYERPAGGEYVYVKYRCQRCKRMGEVFVAESRWDWRIFETPRGEMNESEQEQFLDREPISDAELLDFHCQLRDVQTASELRGEDQSIEQSDSSSDALDTPDAPTKPDTPKKTRKKRST